MPSPEGAKKLSLAVLSTGECVFPGWEKLDGTHLGSNLRQPKVTVERACVGLGRLLGVWRPGAFLRHLCVPCRGLDCSIQHVSSQGERVLVVARPLPLQGLCQSPSARALGNLFSSPLWKASSWLRKEEERREVCRTKPLLGHQGPQALPPPTTTIPGPEVMLWWHEHQIQLTARLCCAALGQSLTSLGLNYLL